MRCVRVLPKKRITQIGVTRLGSELCEGSTKETHYSDWCYEAKR